MPYKLRLTESISLYKDEYHFFHLSYILIDYRSQYLLQHTLQPSHPLILFT